jgi:hypothetical protein
MGHADSPSENSRGLPNGKPLPIADGERRFSPRSRRILGVIGCVLAVWLVSPILRAGHLEGYTANLKSIAIAANRGNLMGQDALVPILTEFLYYTRAGVVLLLRLIGAVFGEVGDAGFRGLVACSFVLLCLSSVVVARRWGGVSTWAALAAIVLTPGVVETSFFFNDNIISAALAVSALALVSRWRSTLAYVCAGGLLAFGTICRTDALLLAPALAGLAWLSYPRKITVLKRGIATVVGATLVFGLVFLVAQATPLDSLAVGRFFVPYSGLRLRILIALWFTGLPVLGLLAIGLTARLLGRPLDGDAVRWFLVLLVYPLFVVAIGVFRLSTEVRYLYPLLTPIIAIHAGTGLEALVKLLLQGGRARIASAVVAGFLILSVVLPPTKVQVRDGPRSLTGRFWSPLLWFRWQQSQQNSMKRVGELVASADAVPMILVIATHFNDDYYLKLRLLEAGYHVHPVSEIFPSCKDGLSVYAKAGHVVAHIRTENPYGRIPLNTQDTRALQVHRGLQCPDVWNADRIYVTAFGFDSRGMDRQPDPALFGDVTKRVGPLDAFCASLEPDLSMLRHPFATVRATSETGVLLRTGEFQTFQLSKDELTAINQLAARAAAPIPISYEEALVRCRPVIHP